MMMMTMTMTMRARARVVGEWWVGLPVARGIPVNPTNKITRRGSERRRNERERERERENESERKIAHE